MIPHDSEKSDQGVHLVRVVNNRSGKTIDVLRKTPSLLKAAHNAPFGADGRFATVQDAAKAAILCCRAPSRRNRSQWISASDIAPFNSKRSLSSWSAGS